jgi:LCP family protein required for cell wall assembly
MGSSATKKRLIIAVVAVVALVAGVVGVFAYVTWGDISRVVIDRPDPATDPPDDGEPDPEDPDLLPTDTKGVVINLLVGSDSRDELDDLEGFGDFAGQRADVVMVLIRVRGGAAILSLPRDLLVPDQCRGGENRINAMLAGCPQGMNGPTLLTLTVERLIGEKVDHYAMIDMAGFQQLVDAIGGYEICVEYAVRDGRSGLDLPAGCTKADGRQTLAWLRSRHTEEFVNGRWRVMPGVSDLARNERQRRFIIDLMLRLSDFSSPQALSSTARAVAPLITVDADLRLRDAVGLAWAMRGIDSGNVSELTVPVRDHTTESGASVLIATEDVSLIVSRFLESHVEVGDDGPEAG